MPSADQPFSRTGLSPELSQVLTELGFTSLTPIQAAALPLLMKGQDLIGQSATGSGKTAAFALPILSRIEPIRHKVQALVLCPTRELCSQVASEFRKLGRRCKDLRVLVLAGGQPGRPQTESLKRGAHIVVGTPGRTLDHLRRGSLEIGRLRTVVLDEADRMLDMGFEDEMNAILEYLPPQRQTVLFSATFPDSITALSAKFQKDPQTIKIGSQERSPIKQECYDVEQEHKVAALVNLMSDINPQSAIVFCNMKAVCREVAQALSRAGISASSLHGDLEQYERDQVMVKFRNGSTRVLVATDVAARGIDISDLDAVFNFDLPHKADTYTHRIGRTGRAGKSGRAITLVNRREQQLITSMFSGMVVERKSLAKSSAHPPSIKADMQTFRISGGRKQKLRPGDILGALTGPTGGLAGSDVGKIEIQDNFAFVAVAMSVAPSAFKRLQAGQIKGRKFHIEWVQ